MALTQRRKAMADASMAATRLHLRLGTKFDRPVDVVTLAQRLGLWVASQPLESLYGFYLRQEQGSGVVLNSKHPESLQRFTCGHEIGHHVLGHDSLIDVRESITSYHGAGLDTKELAAQTFAASVLMPLPLVNAVLRTFAADRPLDPSDVYVVSRELGVSYTAAIAQLQQLGKLDRPRAQELARQRPMSVKARLRDGRPRVADARADVWLLSLGQHGAELQCRVGDEIHLRLPEDLSRGRQWQFADAPPLPVVAGVLDWLGDDTLQFSSAADAPWRPEQPEHRMTAGLEVVVDEHVAATADETSPADGEDGSGWPDLPLAGSREFVFVVREAGEQTLTLVLSEPWIADAEPSALFRVTLHVARARRLETVGVAQPQRAAHVRRLAAA